MKGKEKKRMKEIKVENVKIHNKNERISKWNYRKGILNGGYKAEKNLRSGNCTKSLTSKQEEIMDTRNLSQK